MMKEFEIDTSEKKNYELALASLFKQLYSNYRKLDPSMEDNIWREFIDYSNLRDLAAEPDSYNYDFDFDCEMRSSKAYAHRYCNPKLPDIDHRIKCDPCPNAVCPYINTELPCPLRYNLRETEPCE